MILADDRLVNLGPAHCTLGNLNNAFFTSIYHFSKNSFPGKFFYMWQIERVKIIGDKLKRILVTLHVKYSLLLPK